MIVRMIMADAKDWIRKYFNIPIVSFFDESLTFSVLRAVKDTMLISSILHTITQEDLLILSSGDRARDTEAV